MKKSQLIPVIHMTGINQVFDNVETCVKCGVEKIFIINHTVPANDILSVALTTKKMFHLWVGVNPLGLSISEAITLKINDYIDGLWVDGTLTKEDAKIRTFNGMLFGGLAFKYQRQPSDLEEACKNSMLTTDVATTSGPGTGKAASIEKIKTIRHYLGSHPMAIASGISAQNIEDYMYLADYLLVASSITDKNEMLIEERLIELLNKLK